jgi:hypothetical protein
MDIFHWLGFCPCEHSHLDVKDVLVGFMASGTALAYVLYRSREWLSTLGK